MQYYLVKLNLFIGKWLRFFPERAADLKETCPFLRAHFHGGLDLVSWLRILTENMQRGCLARFGVR
jgi:hypothetical protein